jgi:hypothetical protein
MATNTPIEHVKHTDQPEHMACSYDTPPHEGNSPLGPAAGPQLATTEQEIPTLPDQPPPTRLPHGPPLHDHNRYQLHACHHAKYDDTKVTPKSPSVEEPGRQQLAIIRYC